MAIKRQVCLIYACQIGYWMQEMSCERGEALCSIHWMDKRRNEALAFVQAIFQDTDCYATQGQARRITCLRIAVLFRVILWA
jgi:hypothetical protein